MKILIIGTQFDVELSAIVDAIKGKNSVVSSNLCTFYQGAYAGKQITVCHCPMGTVASAAALTLAVEKYQPDLILNVGLASGYLHMHKGEIVVGLSIINTSSMITDKKKHGAGSNPTAWKLVNYVYGEREKLVEQKANAKAVQSFKNFAFFNSIKNVNYGVIGSGDMLNREYDRIEFLADNYNILCEDMEGISTYYVANSYKIPALDIRIISRNESMDEENERDSGKNLQIIILQFIEYLKAAL